MRFFIGACFVWCWIFPLKRPFSFKLWEAQCQVMWAFTFTWVLKKLRLYKGGNHWSTLGFSLSLSLLFAFLHYIIECNPRLLGLPKKLISVHYCLVSSPFINLLFSKKVHNLLPIHPWVSLNILGAFFVDVIDGYKPITHPSLSFEYVTF